jgi:hypothetical protein
MTPTVLAAACRSKFGIPCPGGRADAADLVWIVALVVIAAIVTTYYIRRSRSRR